MGAPVASWSELIRRRAFFVNSALAFGFAQLFTAALHEAGHGFAAQALGFAPRIYAFYEDNPAGTPEQNLLILAAGPLMSLLIGVVALIWYRSQRSRYSPERLVLFWIAWLGILEFVNYVVVTPFLTAGDTAQIANIVGAPVWLRYAFLLLGLAILFGLARFAVETMVAVAPADVRLETDRERRRYILGGFYLPLLAGVLLTALAGIGGKPINVGLGLLGTLGNIDLIAISLWFVSGIRIDAGLEGEPLRLSALIVVLYVATVIFYDTVLVRGLPL